MDTLNTMSSVQTPIPTHIWPVAENFMLDSRLLSTEGQPIQTSDYHDRSHEHDRQGMILVFVGDHTAERNRASSASLLLDLAGYYTDTVGGAQVLVVVRGAQEAAAQPKQHDTLPFPRAGP